jgi:hypothetical protein
MAKLLPNEPPTRVPTHAPPPETPELLATVRSQVVIGTLVACGFAVVATVIVAAAWLLEQSANLSFSLVLLFVLATAFTAWACARPIQTSTGRPPSWMLTNVHMWVLFTMFPAMGIAIGLGVAVFHARGRYAYSELRQGEYGPVTAKFPGIALVHGEGRPTAIFFATLGITATGLVWSFLPSF